MAIFGVREKGKEIDVTTIQVANTRNRKSNAEKTVSDLQKCHSYNLDPCKEYEVHLLWIEG